MREVTIEGRPAGEWVSFPTTAKHLKEVFDRIGIDGKNYGELHITEYQSSIAGLAGKLTELESLDELNYLGELLKMQFDDDREKFIAAIEYGDHADSLQDIINLAQNLDCYWIYPSVHNEEEYGRYLVDELEEPELPEEAKKYFMYEEYGRDASINDDGMFTEKGYIYNNRNTFTEWYDGRDVPEEYRVTPQPPVQEKEQADLDASAAIQTAATEQPPVLPIILSSEKPADKMKEITDRLEQGILGLYESDRYADYLRTMSKFHDYSLNNTILIAMQGGNLVKGYKQWEKEFDRHVKPGEKAIKILAPSPFTVKKQVEKIDPDTQKPVFDKDGKPVTEEKEIKIPAFRVVSVFDISQTEGKELPALTYELTGNVEQYKDFFAALEKTSPVPVGFEKIEGGAHGYYHLEDKRIALDEGMSELQTLKTLIHEIAHAKLHDIDLNAPLEDLENRPDRRTREVQAESIAYTVCQHYGLDTSDYSFGYVAGWSAGRELAELKSSLETIRSTAAEIINSIDEHIAELQKTQEQAQTSEVQEVTQDAPPQEKPEIPVPDATISVKEMQDYGYSWDGMFPLKQEAAERLFTQDGIEVFRIYEDGTEGAVTSLTDLQEHAEKGGLFGVEKETWEALHEYNAMKQQLRESVPTKEALLLYGKEDSYGIYQLARGDATRDLYFEPYDRLQATGHTVDRANYELIYTAPLTADVTLNSIWEKFDIDHPKDFKGHSLSVSDVVVLHQNGQDTAHYVDSIGFQQVPEFLQEQQTPVFDKLPPEQQQALSDTVQDTLQMLVDADKRIYGDVTGKTLEAIAAQGYSYKDGQLEKQQPEATPDSLLTGETVRTPRGNFHITDMSREQIEAAGFGFHHASEDGKYLIMGNGTQAYAIAAEQPQRDNPLKHVEDTIEQNDNNFDGLINNTPQTPTVADFEQRAKAGEAISVTDLAKAVKAEKREQPQKKPSILKKLDEYKKQAAQQPKDKQKEHKKDLEV